MPSRISDVFIKLKAENRLAFMPFITSGDPDIATTGQLISELGRRGCDMIEIGFPYSDPIADGPTIQASYTRSLGRGLHVEDIFKTVAALPTDNLPPLVAMVAYAIIYRIGPEEFLTKLKLAGFCGMIVPDLPGDEAASFFELAQKHELDLVQLVSPTTTPERVSRILAAASGFVYCISVAGITGVRDDLPPELKDQLRWLREKTDLPLAVGFGIGKPEQIDMLRGDADGVIVGSAIVRQLEPLTESPDQKEAILKQIGDYAAEMLAATKP
ncbi:Tryptophan synthase alpha chain [Polystyrenella longa]|uniref:Tryptophan synthase alpha chain n=1 Tax=Polystyrenella longa TaxID=2528007 RepID=A0A518CRC3_9PLAN|nr:tryptophan synthase subunit alpha [Polystyrenella longa]QDU81782.1 Tryptophan synthase alpha chain [Polystyrenella longa]